MLKKEEGNTPSTQNKMNISGDAFLFTKKKPLFYLISLVVI
jgi:hypothetical protein